MCYPAAYCRAIMLLSEGHCRYASWCCFDIALAYSTDIAIASAQNLTVRALPMRTVLLLLNAVAINHT